MKSYRLADLATAQKYRSIENVAMKEAIARRIAGETLTRGNDWRNGTSESFAKVRCYETIKAVEEVPQNDLGTSDSPYRTAINGAILKLQEEGKLHVLKTRWWKEKRGGGSCRVSKYILGESTAVVHDLLLTLFKSYNKECKIYNKKNINNETSLTQVLQKNYSRKLI